jgi:hypothetical protein
MNDLKNINVGIDSIAKIYIKKKKNIEEDPVVYAATGDIKSIKLHRYKLKDGSIAEEYVQMILTNEDGQSLYFLALNTEKKTFQWPAEKILKKLNKNF